MMQEDVDYQMNYDWKSTKWEICEGLIEIPSKKESTEKYKSIYGIVKQDVNKRKRKLNTTWNEMIP